MSGLICINRPENVIMNPESHKKRQRCCKYKGVFKCGKKYKAQIQMNGVQHYLGLFDTEEEAALTYDQIAKSVLGIRAKTNFAYDPTEFSQLKPSEFLSTVPFITAGTGLNSFSSDDSNSDFLSNQQNPITPPIVSEIISRSKMPHGKKNSQHRIYVGVKLINKKPVFIKNTRDKYPEENNLDIQKKKTHPTAKPEKDPNTPNPNYLQPTGTTGNENIWTSLPSKLVVNRTNPVEYDRGQNSLSAFSRPIESTQHLHRSQSSANEFHTIPYNILQNSQNLPDSSLSVDNIQRDFNEEDDPDWRDQLYYWSGKLTFENERCESPNNMNVIVSRMVWRGCWIGSFLGKPDEKEFEESKNTFEFKSNSIPHEKILVCPILTNDLSKLDMVILNPTTSMITKPISTIFNGYYKMDNDGNGELQDYFDRDFQVVFDMISNGEVMNREDNQVYYNITGKGDSDFGIFILTGTYNPRTGELNMIRQYIADNDSRCINKMRSINRISEFILSNMSKTILFVLTSNQFFPNTDTASGWYLPELAHPFLRFLKAGYTEEIVSIEGGCAPVNPGSLNMEDLENKEFWENPSFRALTENTKKLSEVDTSKYDIVFFVGGFGTMMDFPLSEDVQRVAKEVYEKGGIVGAVCHGPIALANIKLSDGSYLVYGKNVAGFNNEEEALAGLLHLLPTHEGLGKSCEDILKARGGIFTKSEKPFEPHIALDVRLGTGQNPASAGPLADAIIAMANA